MTLLLPDQFDRLAFIKHLLSTAVIQSRLPEPLCSGAVLSLHDAVELYVHMLAEHAGATVAKKADFLDYWPAIKEKLGADLPLQPAMKRLNQARVGLKHSGIHPTREQIEELSSKTVAFFDGASRLVFGIPLDSLSSVSLVGYEPAASRLRRAETLRGEGDLRGAIELCAVAYDELTKIFRWKHHDKTDGSPLPGLTALTRFHSSSLGYEWSTQHRKLGSHLENISEAFAEIESALLILSIGVEYRHVVRFAKIAPRVEGMMDGSSIILGRETTALTDSEVLFAIEFVVEVALRLQEVDTSPPSRGTNHKFEQDEYFAVTLPTKAGRPIRIKKGFVTAIGGGWEAWTFVDDGLARVWRTDARQNVVNYLDKMKATLIHDGAVENG